MKPIIHNGKKVIGVKPWTNKQRLKIYWLMGLWTLFILYLITRQAIWGDLYLIAGQGILFMMSFLVSMFLTRSWYRKQERKNFIYQEDEEK